MTIDIAVLFSGGGRTVLNLLNQIEAGNLDARAAPPAIGRGTPR